MSDLPANVTCAPDRHGKMRYRFRRRGWLSVYLPGSPSTPEFHAAYAEALAAGPIKGAPAQSPKAVTPRSLDDLYNRLRKTVKWGKMSVASQHVQAQVIERFLNRVSGKGRRYGDLLVASVTVEWLEAVLHGMKDTPGAANDLRKKLLKLMDYAITMEWRTDNPAKRTSSYDKGEGFHCWTDEEVAQYRAFHPLGTMARLTLELALNTAARRCNVAMIERDHIRGGKITVAHAKGNNVTTVPLLRTTQAAIEALPAAPIRFLIINKRGRPFTAASFGNRMRKWCDEAGLQHCSIHGLRKATSRLLAESGATDAEGQAVTGHKKAETFAYYRAKANRGALADRALSNLENQGVSNLPGDPANTD